MANIIREVSFDRANRKADSSISMTFTTNLEESTEGFMELDRMIKSNGFLYFSDSKEISQEQIKVLNETKITPSIGRTKSKSKRLRNVLFILWEQSEQTTEFEEFYNNRMEQLIEQIKNRLK